MYQAKTALCVQYLNVQNVRRKKNKVCKVFGASLLNNKTVLNRKKYATTSTGTYLLQG